MILPREPRGDPPWQRFAFDRLHGHRCAGLREGGEPRGVQCRTIEPGQRDQRDVVGIGIHGVRLERFCTVDPGLAARNAQVDQLAAAEKTEVRIRADKRVPFEPRLDDEHVAFVATCSARRGTNFIAGFKREQWLVAVDDI